MHDFDFLVGTWAVTNRRLKQRLKGSREWECFEGQLRARLYMGGQAIVDDNVLRAPAATYRAITVRTFDPAKHKWSIWWFDGRKPGDLDPPLVGSFEQGVGTFFAEDSLDGRPIRVRFIWRHAGRHALWEQAYSEDDGQTWEVNWIMEMTRTAS
jgi:hypothetical protein